MLGRYVAGTLMILGVAMVVTPDSPETPADPQVARADTSALAVASATSTLRAPAEPRSAQSVLSAPTPKALAADPSVIDAAVAEALDAAMPSDEGETVDISAYQPAAEAPEPGTSTAGLSTSEVPTSEVPASGLPASEVPASAEGLGGIEALAGLAPLSPSVSEPQATETPAAAPSEPALRYVSGSRVNVRSGPSTQFSVVSSVGYGDAVEIMDEVGDGWSEIRITTTGETGFMASRFLSASLN